jgi:hypothetical protein
MTITPEERDAMIRLRSIMEGTVPEQLPTKNNNRSLSESTVVELAGPGQVTSADVDAMASVLTRLNSLSNHVVDDMITESAQNTIVRDAIVTERIQNGVKVGRYQILIKEDKTRLAGKQFFSIYNSLTNDTIADDISLYETAITVVKLLNSGKFANCPEIRQLFEQDDLYTSHKVDAVRYKRRLSTVTDSTKRDIYESRMQGSMDRCMTAKKTIKMLAGNAN